MKNFAYACMGGIWIFILAVYLAFGTGCSGVPDPVYARTPDQQADAAVTVTTMCPGGGRGSGVIVSPTEVLTAYHVVACDDMTVVESNLYTITDVHGTGHLAMLDTVSIDADIARLYLVGDVTFNFSPVSVAPPPPTRARVCGSYAVPERSQTCGEIQPATKVRWTKHVSGDLQHTALTRFGNSGSGLYDTDGHLIGIVTHLWYCNDLLAVCGGRASSLWSRRVLVP